MVQAERTLAYRSVIREFFQSSIGMLYCRICLLCDKLLLIKIKSAKNVAEKMQEEKI